MGLIYILADDLDLLNSLGSLFSRAGFNIVTFNQTSIFLNKLIEYPPQCIVAEVLASKASTLELLIEMKSTTNTVPIVLITPNNDISTAVEALRTGATDYIEMPVVDRVLIESVKRAIAEYK